MDGRHEISSKLIVHSNLHVFDKELMEKEKIGINKAMSILDGIMLERFIKFEASHIEKLLISLDLVNAIEYLHYKNVAHREIKTSSIIIMKNKQTKLIFRDEHAKRIINDNEYRKILGKNLDIGTTTYDLWSFGLVLNAIFSSTEEPKNINYLHSPILYHEYKFKISSVIKNDKMIKLIIKLTDHSSNYSIQDAKSELFEIFYKEVKNVKHDLDNILFISNTHGLGLNRKDNNIKLTDPIKNKYVNILMLKIQKYLVVYKQMIKNSINKILDIVLTNTSLQEMYLRDVNLNGLGHSSYHKRRSIFARKLSKFMTEKYKVEDFYGITLTPDMVRKFTKRLKVNELKSNDIMMDKDDPNYRLGEGGFSKVRKAKFINRDIAVKLLSRFNMEAFTKELVIMKKFYHSYIPTVYGIFQKIDDDENISLNIAMELINGKTLDVVLRHGNLLELEKIIVLLDLALVLEYIHEFNLIHRDLKPSNIMINEKLDVKLIDFGISRSGNSSQNYQATHILGTCTYMAPENYISAKKPLVFEDEENPDIITEENSDNESSYISEEEEFVLPVITNKVDVWAYGLIANEVLNGEKPWAFVGKRINDALITSYLMNRVEYKFAKPIIDPKLKLLLESCTKIDPEERYDIKQAKFNLLDILFIRIKECSGLHDVLFSNYKTKDYNKNFEHKLEKRLFYLATKINYYLLLYQYLISKTNGKKFRSVNNVIFKNSNLNFNSETNLLDEKSDDYNQNQGKTIESNGSDGGRKTKFNIFNNQLFVNVQSRNSNGNLKIDSINSGNSGGKSPSIENYNNNFNNNGLGGLFGSNNMNYKRSPSKLIIGGPSSAINNLNQLSCLNKNITHSIIKKGQPIMSNNKNINNNDAASLSLHKKPAKADKSTDNVFSKTSSSFIYDLDSGINLNALNVNEKESNKTLSNKNVENDGNIKFSFSQNKNSVNTSENLNDIKSEYLLQNSSTPNIKDKKVLNKKNGNKTVKFLINNNIKNKQVNRSFKSIAFIKSN